MRKKSIEFVLMNKFNEWVNSIKDENVQSLVRKNTIITGGAIASLFLDEKVNDFDLYFKNKLTAEAVAKYYVTLFLENNKCQNKIKVLTTEDRVQIRIQSAGMATPSGSGYQYFEQTERNEAANYLELAFMKAEQETEEEYQPVFLSQNAITLSNQVQLIIRFYGNAKTIHENFDFDHCMNYWDSETGNLTTRKKSLESLLARELVYGGSKYPICSVVRTRKFIKRGWTINAGQYLKMMWQIKDLNLEDYAVLEDQLIGVDTAYFSELLQVLKGKNLKDIDSTYLAQLIDKIF